MECPNGEITCENRIKSKIKITIDKSSIELKTKGSACVKKESSIDPSSEAVKCWRFWGKKNGQLTQEYFGCGVQASYQPHPDLPNNGAWLMLDGVRQIADYYYYWSGDDGGGGFHTRGIEIFSGDEQGYIPGGCEKCLIVTCRVVVTTESGANYKSKWGTKCDYEVSCDEDCLPGHIKCKSNHSPGYCCIPCKETAEKINILAAKIR